MANIATFEFLCAALSLALWFLPYPIFACQAASQAIGVSARVNSRGGTDHDQ